jgi:hypothetical protein
MRPIFFAFILLTCAGCRSAQDRTAPAGMTRTTPGERIAGERLQDSKVPIGDVIERSGN